MLAQENPPRAKRRGGVLLGKPAKKNRAPEGQREPNAQSGCTYGMWKGSTGNVDLNPGECTRSHCRTAARSSSPTSSEPKDLEASSVQPSFRVIIEFHKPISIIDMHRYLIEG